MITTKRHSSFLMKEQYCEYFKDKHYVLSAESQVLDEYLQTMTSYK